MGDQDTGTPSRAELRTYQHPSYLLVFVYLFVCFLAYLFIYFTLPSLQKPHKVISSPLSVKTANYYVVDTSIPQTHIVMSVSIAVYENYTHPWKPDLNMTSEHSNACLYLIQLKINTNQGWLKNKRPT